LLRQLQAGQQRAGWSDTRCKQDRPQPPAVDAGSLGGAPSTWDRNLRAARANEPPSATGGWPAASTRARWWSSAKIDDSGPWTQLCYHTKRLQLPSNVRRLNQIGCRPVHRIDLPGFCREDL